MLCSRVQLRSQGPGTTAVKILPCGSWNCETCAPHRRKQLMAIAASGLPTICLTLTHVFTPGSNQEEHYRRLHNAWKLLVKRILRQLSKPPEQRWILTHKDGGQYQDLRYLEITKKTKAKRIKKLHYMAFAEETKNGEPHLHILLRTVFIPQPWIAEQMQEIIQSPITWIEKIKGPRAAIAYVTKYVTKAPAQFGKSRRYWVSRWYQLIKRERTKQPLYDRINAKVVFQEFTELLREIVVQGLIPKVIGKSELLLYHRKSIRDRVLYDRIFENDAEKMTSYLWLATWRQRCRV